MPESKIHIALITTWFPPRTGVAVNRMQSFVKYLDKTKYKITVLTHGLQGELHYEENDNVSIYRLKNSSFLKYFPTKAGEQKVIHQAKVFWNVMLRFLQPYEFFNWKEEAVKQLQKIHINKKINLLISSYSPVEPHLAAEEFCSKHNDIKWIVDMRDEMSKNPHITNRVKKQFLKIEQKINHRANALTTVSEPILEDFKKLIPNLKYYEEVRNGFDHNLTFPYTFNEVFTICYAGTFYGKRKPDTFFEGLSAFVNKTNATFKIKFIGTNKNFKIPSQFESLCEFTEKVSQDEAVKSMFNADCNLLILPPVDGKGVYSGKIFDYLSVLKPIIAVVDSSDVAAKLILECNAGYIASFDNIFQIEDALNTTYELWKNKKILPISKDKIAMLHRKFQVKKLENIIDKLVIQ